MLEVEVRYRSADRAEVERRLRQLGATWAGERVETDLYFQAPDRDLKARDEALRLRRCGDHNYLTFKGPRRDDGTKTRTEIEVPLGDGPAAAADAERLLAALGFRPAGTVHKRRTVYRLRRDGFAVLACLDEVERAGSFVELEILTTEEQYEAARAALGATAAELGLSEPEHRSYLSLVWQATGLE